MKTKPMPRIHQLSWKQTWKAFCSLCRKFKLNAQESMVLFNQVMQAWIEEHQPRTK